MDSIRKNMVSIMEEYLVSSILFAKYLETDGKSNALYNCDFKYVRLILASLELTLWKENFITKDNEKRVSGNLITSIRDEFMNIVARKQDNKWIIGDISFDDAYTLIDVIRNKLAHGDFLIKDDTIEICVDGYYGKININKLLHFTSVLSSYFESIKKTGVNKRPIGINTVSVNDQVRHIKSKEQLKYIVDHFYYLEFKDNPIFPRTRDEAYLGAIEQAYAWIKRDLYSSIKRCGKLPDIPKLIKTLNESLERYGVHISCEVSKADDIAGKEKLYDIYNKVKYEFELAPLENQIKYINRILLYLANEEDRKLNLQMGLICNNNLVDVLEDDRDIDLDEAVRKVNLSSLLENIDMPVISMYIALFYANYIYGLERVYTNETRDHLEDLDAGLLFDFSKLDLSAFKPKVLDLSNEFIGFKDQLVSMENAYNKALNGLNKVQSNYSNYIASNRNKSIRELSEVIKVLDSKVNEAREKFKSIEGLYLRSKDFMDNRFDDYKRNRAIIEHLRNSIAHGNVYLYRYDGDGSVDDAMLVFKDIYEGEVKFELSIRIIDFITLFNYYNVYKLLDYIDSNLMMYGEPSKILRLD